MVGEITRLPNNYMCGTKFDIEKFDDTWADIYTKGFYQTGQLEFYNVKVFYSNAKLYHNDETRKCQNQQRRKEKVKK